MVADMDHSHRSRLRPWSPGLSRWLWRVLATLALAVAAFVGGTASTSILPTLVQTEHYSAEARLTPLPSQRSTLHSPTSFGDIDLIFGGPLPAPGVDATVQLKANITELFDQRPVSVQSLQPSSAEVDAALRTAALQLGLKFAAGALLTMVLLLGILALGRRSRPSLAQVTAAVIAVTTTLAFSGIGAWQAYRPGNLATFKTTSLIGAVRSNAGLLADVQTRAEQATPYVQNLLALSQALQEKFVPENLDQPAAARFLLVSDIHGANQYPIMKKIIEDEHITAVIDTGDLLNFGSVTEAEVTGIFQSIEALPVPYIFVRGNHDASSPTDQSLLQRMARIPNVILLEPTPEQYTQVAVRGITIAGFNDPRFFGDDNQDNAAKQKPAIAAYQAAFKGRPLPDIVISHEPAAVEAVQAGSIRINGHMHTPDLQGNRIQVGTFTGGGTMSHYLTQSPANGTQDDGELPGQPYAFDIAVFGDTCALTSLTRYSYRHLIEGRPAYDDVSVINGKTIAKPPAAGRVCNASLGITRSHVDAQTPPEIPPPTTTVPTIMPTVPVSPIEPDPRQSLTAPTPTRAP